MSVVFLRKRVYNGQMFDYKGIIFDMDGVLFDTEHFYYKRREIFLNGRGIDIKHLPPSFFIGGNMKQVWQAILREDYDKWDISSLQKEYTEHKLAHPLPYRNLLFPMVPALLALLKENGFKIGLASSSTKSDILRALGETDLTDYFDVILSGEEFEESKPNPAIYNEAARCLSLPKKSLLIIEDSEKGIQAGISAGINVWAIKDKFFGLEQTQATEIIDNLKVVYNRVKDVK